MSFAWKMNGVAVAAPVKLTCDDEVIWSSSTGRTSTGKMVGTIIATKKSLSVEWGVLTAAEAKKIFDNSKEFFTLEFSEYGQTTTITAYRSALKKEALGYIGDGIFYYKSVSTSLIQQ